jgi:uncharacterized membrane protein
MSENVKALDRTAGKSLKASETLRKIVFAGIFAAITYVVFTFLSIPVPIPGGKVTVHLGNAFLALGALLLGSVYGSLGGAIGLTIADLIDPVYIVEAPATFIIKFIIGLIVGGIAHGIGHVDSEKNQKKVLVWTIIAVVAGMAFNAVGDPSIRYVYKRFILGKAAADVTFMINFVVTLINSVISTVIAVVLYIALRKPFKKIMRQ